MRKLLTMLAVLSSFCGAVQAEDRVYIGIGVVHFSNADAGSPFNNDYEDWADHYGVNIEYQFDLKSDSDDYFYTSLSVGKTNAKTRDIEGWECSGCSINTSLEIGFKWRIK